MSHADAASRHEADRKRLLARFAAAARRVRDGASPVAVHDVRVAARRLEAALDLWRDRLKRRPARRARRALRDLRRSLGPGGEVSASLALLAERWPHLGPDARAVALCVIARGRHRLGGLNARGAGICTRRKMERLQKQIEQAWPGLPSHAASSSWIEWACERLVIRRTRAQAALRQAQSTTTDDCLHSARIAIKRWRYGVERLEAVAPGGTEPGRPWFKTIQETLGRVQDLRVLRDHTIRLMAGLDLPARRVALAGQLRLLEDLEAERSTRVAEFRHVVASALPPLTRSLEKRAPCR